MARAGEVMENPISGQRIIFRKTADDTGGELLEVESVYTKWWMVRSEHWKRARS
jgi:hypothetical protein